MIHSNLCLATSAVEAPVGRMSEEFFDEKLGRRFRGGGDVASHKSGNRLNGDLIFW